MKRAIINGLTIVSAAAMILLAGCGNQNAVNNTMNTKQMNIDTSQKSTDQPTAQPSAQPSVQKADNIYMTIEAGSKLAPDGKLHDAFINGNITVTVGKPVTLHIYNYDEGSHTYTAPDLNLNVIVKGSEKEGVPSVTDFTFTPQKTGTYTWNCLVPCDEDNGDYAMSHDGYMKGTIKVVPAEGAVQHVSLVVNADYALGSDGKMHDVFTPGSFTVNAGQKVEVTVYNFDDQAHSIVNEQLGLSLMAAGSQKDGVPGITTATFTPQKAGQYEWKCTVPCDPWAMNTDGFMKGKINVQ